VLLCVDIGNTNVTLGVYDGEQLIAHWRVSTDHQKMPDEYGMTLLAVMAHRGLSPQQIDGVALASVVPPVTDTLREAIQEYLPVAPLIVDTGVRTGVSVRYDPPRDVGADRIVNAAAAYRIYGGPACIVDFGTATTFDALSADGDYLGGAIAPGISIAADALFQRTAKLPRVELARPPAAIGRNTVHSMQSGLLFGYVSMVEGMVARFRRELGRGMKVVATGGLAEVLARETPVLEILAPWLTLDGLRMVYDMNRGRPRL